jgi:thiosulfate/3-mercaptopyruvate sulfurtransferase
MTEEPKARPRLGPVIGPIVDVAWWRAHRDEVVLADVRWYLDGRSGRDAYLREHLPGGSPEAGRHPLSAPEVFARGMAEAGIGDDDVVVAYDDAGGVVAARLAWMLRETGHRAALLDGGLAAYDGPTDSGPVTRPRARFSPRPWPAASLAGLDDVLAGGNVLVDARDANRFRGEFEPVDPRAGHVPGARSLPCRGNLDQDGRFLPVEQLRRRFAQIGVPDAGAVVSYCGSGINACHNLLAMEHAGLGRGRLWPGSWSQYSHRMDLEAELGN